MRPMPPDSVLADPSFRERYTLEERLGGGGMGSVWRGQQRALGRPVAIKFMSPDLIETPEFRDRFAAEARAVARLIHSHVVAVFDFGIAGDTPYIVTELVEGAPLDQLLADNRLGPCARMEVAHQILTALDAIHALGVVHRDVKPTNIVVATGGCVHAKLIDFGIAKKLGEQSRLTRMGVVLGSPAYMSPEQASGQPLTPASDLYSLTVVIYEMVLGALPFVAANALQTAHLRLLRDAHVPTDLLPAVADLLRRGLSRDPAQRLLDAAAYRDALARAVDEVKAAAAFYPQERTLIQRFIPMPQPAAHTLVGTAAAELPQLPPRQEHSPDGITAPGERRRPLVAVAILALLLLAAAAARLAHHRARRPGAPQPQVTTR